MGNCLFSGFGDGNEVAKVITSNGGIMEFNTPITVESITDEFPGHGIFRSHDLFWKPLPHNEVLLAGESYYLYPIDNKKKGVENGHSLARIGHVRSNSVPNQSLVAPYRMSFECQGLFKRGLYTETVARHGNNGVWKVKLVISPEQLLEILSQEARTQELIESVRTVAKCGNIGVSSMAFSDLWSLSSARIVSSKKQEI